MSDKSTSAVFKWALLHVFPLGSYDAFRQQKLRELHYNVTVGSEPLHASSMAWNEYMYWAPKYMLEIPSGA